MKKIITLLAIALSVVVFTNCEKNEDLIKTTIVSFEGNFDGIDHLVDFSDPSTSTLDITVYTNDIASSDRTFSLYVSEESTALPSNYAFPTSVTIPANTNMGIVTLDAAAVDGILIVGVVNADGVIPTPELTINIIKFCSTDLAGTYSVVTNGVSTDNAPNNPLVNHPYTVVITSTGELDYIITDAFGDAYQQWYCAPYGYCFDTPGFFTDACGVISGSFQDFFDSTVVLTGTNNYDGTLTISFSNGFGDTGTSVYTKQ